MRIVEPQEVLDQLSGATIASSSVDGEDGLNINMEDGRLLIIVGAFVLSVVRMPEETLH